MDGPFGLHELLSQLPLGFALEVGVVLQEVSSGRAVLGFGL